MKSKTPGHFLLILEALLYNLPKIDNPEYGDPDAHAVANIIAAICLGLTNCENWNVLYLVSSTPRNTSVWLNLRGSDAKNRNRRFWLEEFLMVCLKSWMLAEYRVARTVRYGEFKEKDKLSPFEIAEYSHGNTLFLSRNTYGDELHWEREKIRLMKRYADRKILVRRAHCHKSWRFDPIRGYHYHIQTYKLRLAGKRYLGLMYSEEYIKLPREFRPPKPF